MNIIAIIPARGGSKGIPRKNIRLLNGQPLISYSIRTALKSKYINKVIVTTDDEEIALVAKRCNANVVKRSPDLATDEIPLDSVIFDVVKKRESQGEKIDIVVTLQPTSPLLKTATLDKIIERLIISDFESIITVVSDPHLSWTKVSGKYVPNFKERKNRQYLPPGYRETGAVLASKRHVITEYSRLGSKVDLYEMDITESVDIDSPMDWWIAEKLIKRKKVVIRVDGYKEIGLGHIYRMLTLANYIMDHEIIFLMDSQYHLGIDMVKAHNFKIEYFDNDPLPKIKQLRPDIIINDILDTNREYVQALKALEIKVFNFEDLGNGAEYADGVFNALYPGNIPCENFYTGESYYCARADLLNAKIKVISEKVDNILITFGGTDPNNLTVRSLKAIEKLNYDCKISVIIGPGYTHRESLEQEIKKIKKEVKIFEKVVSMAEHLLNADIILSSAGRTMYEIAIVGTPAIIIAQNNREMTHLFGHNYNGFINLGHHSEVSEDLICNTLERLINNVDLRKIMNKRMLQHDLKDGIERVCSIIFKD